MDANGPNGGVELSTAEGTRLIDQIAEVGRPVMVLSGGEPLLRDDIFELARYGADKGLRMAMGTNGTLIDDAVAAQLKRSGINRVAISLDSSTSEVHDRIRGVKGSWTGALRGIRASLQAGIGVQANVTVTRQNSHDIEPILAMVRRLGITDVHLFFLIPTGRGREEDAIRPVEYEALIRTALSRKDDALTLRPTCAPQFIRIAKQMGLDTERWGRGCIAGINYCRVNNNGAVTPCPYLHLVVGNVRTTSFEDIWNSTAFAAMRDPLNLKGRCGRCEYRQVCGGCRARAFSRADPGGFVRIEDADLTALFEEDPWCLHEPVNEVR